MAASGLRALLAALLHTASGLTAVEERSRIDEYFFQISMGNITAIVDMFDDDFEAVFPPLAVAHFAGGAITDKTELTAFYTGLIGELETRKGRATDVILDGRKAAVPLHIEGTHASTGAAFSEDNLNMWTFAANGKFQQMRIFSGGDVPGGPVPNVTRVTFADPARPGRMVNASVCVPHGSDKVPLLIFAHGWMVAADDYDYLCRQLAVSESPFVVTMIETALEDPGVQPPLLRPLADDASFLSHKMLKAQGTLFSGRLNGQVVLGGHSMGGGTTMLAAASGAKADALVLWAPGLYGNPEVNETVSGQVTLPSLIMLGNDDCVNVGDVPLRGVDTYKKIGSKKKALVVLKDANHCFFSTPVRGVCAYDICNDVPRLQQQSVGLKLFRSFAAAALDGTATKWADVTSMIAAGKDFSTGVEWQYDITDIGQTDVSKITYEFCPAACCSDALAEMGTCSKGIFI